MKLFLHCRDIGESPLFDDFSVDNSVNGGLHNLNFSARGGLSRKLAFVCSCALKECDDKRSFSHDMNYLFFPIWKRSAVAAQLPAAIHPSPSIQFHR